MEGKTEVLPDVGELYPMLREAAEKGDKDRLAYVKDCAVKLGHGGLLLDVAQYIPISDAEKFAAFRGSTKIRGASGPDGNYWPSTPLLYKQLFWDERDQDLFYSDLGEDAKALAARGMFTNMAKKETVDEAKAVREEAREQIYRAFVRAGDLPKIGKEWAYEFWKKEANETAVALARDQKTSVQLMAKRELDTDLLTNFDECARYFEALCKIDDYKNRNGFGAKLDNFAETLRSSVYPIVLEYGMDMLNELVSNRPGAFLEDGNYAWYVDTVRAIESIAKRAGQPHESVISIELGKLGMKMEALRSKANPPEKTE